MKEYLSKAKKDLKSTGEILRTIFMAKKEIGIKATLYYLAIILKNKAMVKLLNRL